MIDMGDDQSLPEDEAIAAAHPTKTGRHDLYAEAMRLVGAKHSKGALVELVNWLLTQRAETDPYPAPVRDALGVRDTRENGTTTGEEKPTR